MRALTLVLLTASLGSIAGCGGAGDSSRPDDEENVDSVRAALSDTDPVSDAIDASCSTTSVKGLATQLVEEIQCLQPGTLERIDGIDGLTLEDAVFPYLQTPAAKAIEKAQQQRGTTMTINSALRTLPQQYLLYQWYKAGRCGISLAAAPGKSNHESGLAVDVDDSSGWRPAMEANEMKWLGASDPVHFDYIGDGKVELTGLSVLAFQKLWNVNHPDDRIDEDSLYGADTEKRIALSPVGGFPKGPDCAQPDASAPSPPAPVPDAGEPPPKTTEAAPVAPASEDGCSVAYAGAGRDGSSGSSGIPIALGFATLVLAARGRARRASNRVTHARATVA
ncbi:N-acetylmuramoyl-L-alanine amidase [Labilithrix luteola]|uniref:N-acetylmuramoyl-L-alanine amidase n=2 Tax=Labilithrix luteola TaxID=1391654 RepID=A0A0K1Q0F6_9BACT|nr:N-acetylmuramoyl-L-alanine amidase [Labilithrix luteola]